MDGDAGRGEAKPVSVRMLSTKLRIHGKGTLWWTVAEAKLTLLQARLVII